MALDHPFSFQLYSARNFPPLLGQLETLKRLGYSNVEPFGGLYGDVGALREALDETGLSAASGHFALDQLETDLPSALAIARRLGVGTVVAPYLLPELRPTDTEGWKQLGRRLGTVGKALQGEGLFFAWHNHDFEFVALADGSYPIEHLLADAAVMLEVDAAWIARAGEDPLAWIRRFSGRIAACHVKDIAPAGTAGDEDGWADVGHGVLDWAALWPAAAAAGARIMIAEHDKPASFERFATRSLETMKRLAA